LLRIKLSLFSSNGQLESHGLLTKNRRGLALCSGLALKC
jgi:hypothetical protein